MPQCDGDYITLSRQKGFWWRSVQSETTHFQRGFALAVETARHPGFSITRPACCCSPSSGLVKWSPWTQAGRDAGSLNSLARLHSLNQLTKSVVREWAEFNTHYADTMIAVFTAVCLTDSNKVNNALLICQPGTDSRALLQPEWHQSCFRSLAKNISVCMVPAQRAHEEPPLTMCFTNWRRKYATQCKQENLNNEKRPNKTNLPWFGHFLPHTARKRDGLILPRWASHVAQYTVGAV